MTADIDPGVVDALLAESPVFAALDGAVRDAVGAALEVRAVPAGEVLIRQGDTADGMFLVASGRLQVRFTREDGERLVLGEEGRGDVTGEMALVSDSPRSADVVALRDSHVLFLSTDAFDRIVAAHPSALRSVTGALVRKLARTARYGAEPSPARTIVVVPLDRSPAARSLGADLAPTVSRVTGATRLVDAATVREQLGAERSPFDEATWFERTERGADTVIYVADPDDERWTAACLGRADLVLLAASAGAGPVTGPTLPSGSAHRELVLLHDPPTVVPRGTAAWLARHDLDRHHHIRTDRAADYERVARLVTGRGVGVVFGGGGARGIAHVGVLRALQELALPIDAVGGTSIGSIMAGAVARGLGPDETEELLRAAVVDGRSPVDFTLPTLSLASGNRVTQRIKDGAGGMDLEDAWVACFCVSTNLTRGAAEIHTEGPAWRAIRASFSVPGIFPPVPNDLGEVLVDGGMVDNLPVTPMRALHPGIRVIAVDVGAVREPLTAAIPTTGAVSGWGYLWSQVRSRSLGNLASLPRILMRLTELGAQGGDDRGDLYLRPGVDAVSLLDFSAFDELLDIGSRDAEPALSKWLAGDDAPTF